MPTKRPTLLQKLEVIEDAARTRNTHRIAAKWKDYLSTIRKWQKNNERIKGVAEKTLKKLATYAGR